MAAESSRFGSGSRLFIGLLFFLSGAAGLIYQVTWMRRLMGILGVTSASVTTVLAVFMGGLALGSYLFGRISDRSTSPIALYGWLELGIAVSGIASIYLLDRLPAFYLSLAPHGQPPSILLRMSCAALALLLPTTLMGGTLPTIIKGLARRTELIGDDVGFLYAINTLGAVAGTIAASGFLILQFGVSGSILFAGALNLLAAAGTALLIFALRGQPAAAGAKQSHSRTAKAAGTAEQNDIAADRSGLRLVSIAFFFSGLAALAYEVLWTRYLIYIVHDNSVAAFSTMLAAFLLGIVFGSIIGTALVRGRDKNGLIELFGNILILLGICSLLTAALMDILAQPEGGEGFGSKLAGLPAFVKCLLILIVPTTLCGTTFVIVSKYCSRSRETVGADVGKIYAYNTFGAIIGSILGGLVILPLAGLRSGLSCLAAVNLLMGLILLISIRRGSARPLRFSDGLLALVFVLSAFSLVKSYNPMEASHVLPGDDLLFFEDGTESTIAVIKPQVGGLHFIVNGDIQAGTEPNAQVSLRFLGHLPPMLNPNPKEGLVICLGTGITAGSMLQHPIEHLDIVELSPIVPAIQHFFTDLNFAPLSDPRTTLHREDGRNFLFRSAKKYDVITTDPLDPNDAGMTLLYSKEYFELVRDHLNEGGVTSQWLPPSPDLSFDDEYYKILVRSFVEVFPNASIWQADFTTVIVGIKGEAGVSLDEFKQRFEAAGVRESFRRIDINSADQLLGNFLGGPQMLKRFTGPGRLNTDNWPLLEFYGTRTAGQATKGALDLLIAAGDRDYSNWFARPAALLENGQSGRAPH